MMKRSITATFEIVTPMFLGGADQQVNRIRETSIKGALTFWWRALNYAGFVKKAKGNKVAALNKMQEKEQELFGGPKGQGIFLLKIIRQPEGSGRRKGDRLFEAGSQIVGPGARYMGYGLMGAIGDSAGVLERPCIVNGKFEVRLIYKQSRIVQMNGIIQALKLFGLLGGLGSRVRRGWGSVALVNLTNSVSENSTSWRASKCKTEFSEQLRDVFSEPEFGVELRQSGVDWPVTAFAAQSRCFVTVSEKPNALKTLNEIGERFQFYRAWGYSANGTREPKVNNMQSLKNFEDDHHWFKKPEFQGENPEFVPERTAFGLPHNYDVNTGVSGDGDIDRRASPLMFHIHRTNEITFAVLLLMPNQFLPTNRVRAAGTSKTYNFHRDGLPVLENFLTGSVVRRRISDASDKKGSVHKTLTQIFPREVST